MPTMSWADEPFTLSEASEDIGEWLSGVGQGMTGLGFTLSSTGSNWVAGNQGQFTVVVFYIFLGGRNFQQLAICAAESGPTSDTDQVNGSVINMIHGIAVL